MNAKKDLQDIAEDLEDNMAYLRTILTAAQDKIQFHLSNKSLLGPYQQLLSLYVSELTLLLDLAERHLGEMEREVDTVTDLIYANVP